MGLSSLEHQERALYWGGINDIAFIDHRRNSHEGFNAFSRIEFDAANQYLGCVGDLPSTRQLAAYRGITPTMLCYSTVCVESEECTCSVGPTISLQSFQGGDT
jgi:hypothetical protein